MIQMAFSSISLHSQPGRCQTLHKLSHHNKSWSDYSNVIFDNQLSFDIDANQNYLDILRDLKLLEKLLWQLFDGWELHEFDCEGFSSFAGKDVNLALRQILTMVIVAYFEDVRSYYLCGKARILKTVQCSMEKPVFSCLIRSIPSILQSIIWTGLLLNISILLKRVEFCPPCSS